MKNIICIILLFSIAKSSAQTLSAKMIAPNEVELTITNPNQEWFFMPNNRDRAEFVYYSLNNTKTSKYELAYDLLDESGNLLDVCIETINLTLKQPVKVINVNDDNYRGLLTGQFNSEDTIVYTYQLGDIFSTLCKSAKDKDVYIRFVLVHEEINKLEDFKDYKHYFRDNTFFNGQLYSKKIPLKIK